MRQNVLIVDDSGWGKSSVVEEALDIFGVRQHEIVRIGASSTMEGFGHPGVREESVDEEGTRRRKHYVSDPPISVARYICIDELLSLLTNTSGNANLRMMTEVCSWIEKCRGYVLKQGIKHAEPEDHARYIRMEGDGQWTFMIPGTFIGLTTEMPEKVQEAAKKGGFMNRFTAIMDTDDNDAANLCLRGKVWTQKPELEREYRKTREMLAAFNGNLNSAGLLALQEPPGNLVDIVNDISGRNRFVEIANDMGIRTKSITSLRETVDIERYIVGYAILRSVEEQKGFAPSDEIVTVEYTKVDAEAVGHHFYGVYNQKLSELESLKMKKAPTVSVGLKHIEAMVKAAKGEDRVFATADFQECYRDITRQPLTKATANKILNTLQSRGVVERLKSGRKAHNVLLVTPEEAARIAVE